MASAIAGLPSTPAPTTATTGGATQLSSSDFLNLMIQQLEQQDPLNPTDSNQLLTQMSQISTLQSNTQMQSSLTSLTLQQSIGAGGNLIGKTVTGLDPNGNLLSGIVTSIKVSNQQVNLELDNGSELPMGNVTQISPTSATALATAAANNPALQQLLAGAATPTTTPTDPTATAVGATVTPAVTTSVLPAARSKLASVISALAGVSQ